MPITALLSGFADESSQNKLAREQFTAMAAIGLRRYTIRFIDVGQGIKNAMELTGSELAQIAELHQEFGLSVASLGSPIGKIKLLDQEDGTSNRYVPFAEYLEKDVATACRLAQTLETNLVRGFSFYHPRGEDPAAYVSQAVDQLGQIADACGREGLVFGLEIEANLIGQTGQLLQDIHCQIDHPALVLIYDAANLLVQGYSADETYDQYLAMKAGLGWLHVKDYQPQETGQKGGHVDEDSLCEFQPVSHGSGVHQRILRDLVESPPEFYQQLTDRGLPGLLLDLEPHVRGGGQFGGYSGADGFGVALRALCTAIEETGMQHDLRDRDDLG